MVAHVNTRLIKDVRPTESLVPPRRGSRQIYRSRRRCGEDTNKIGNKKSRSQRPDEPSNKMTDSGDIQIELGGETSIK